MPELLPMDIGNTVTTIRRTGSSQSLTEENQRGRSSSVSSAKKRKKGMIASPEGTNNPRWTISLIQQWNAEIEDFSGQTLTRDMIGKAFNAAFRVAKQCYEEYDKADYEEKIENLEKEISILKNDRNQMETDSSENKIIEEIKNLKNEFENVKQAVNFLGPNSYVNKARANQNQVQKEKIYFDKEFRITVKLGGEKLSDNEFEKVKRDISKIIQPLKNGIRIRYIRKSLAGNAVICLDSPACKEKTKNLLKENHSVYDPEDKQIPLVIRDAPQHMSTEVLKENFISYNPETFNNYKTEDFNLKWIVRPNQINANKTLQAFVSKSLAQNLLSKNRLFLEYESCRIDLWYQTPRRCNKCNKLGHSERFCRNQPTCNICNSQDHNIDSCPNKDNPFCINCHDLKLNDVCHKSSSKNCEAWKRSTAKQNEDLYNFVWY